MVTASPRQVAGALIADPAMARLGSRPMASTANARGTTYHFEYGTTDAYGLVTPPADVDVLLLAPRMVGSAVARGGARFVAYATACVRPERFGTGPVPAIQKVLKLAGLSMNDIDLIELNEAFAAQVLACLRELPIDPDRLNVNGGAIALGHPLGCTGAKLTTTLVHELRRRKARYGLVTMCVGGGMGAAGIFERM